MSRLAGEEREPALDGLRGLAIGLVLLFHGFSQVYTAPDRPGLLFLQRAFAACGGGVDLFFVLSGFLIGRILLRHRDAGNLFAVFYLRRAGRILPTYWLLLASFGLAQLSPTLVDVGGPAYFDPGIPFGSYLVFWQNNLFAVRQTIGPWWLVATWSLAVEEQFYLVAPWITKHLSARTLGLLACGLLVLCPLGRQYLLHETRNPFGAIYLTAVRLDGLMAGLLLALCSQRAGLESFLQARRRPVGIIALVFLFACFALPAFAPAFWAAHALIWGPSGLALGFAWVLLAARLRGPNPLAWFLRWAPLRYLGNLSYFVYLFHLPALYVMHAYAFHRLPGHVASSDSVVTLIAFATTIVLAVLSRHAIEQPLIRLVHRHRYTSAA